MDALAALLDGPRAREAFLLRMVMSPPWSVRVQDEAPLSVVAVVRGEAWVFPDVGEAVHLGRGDVAIHAGPCAVHVRRRGLDAAAGRDPPGTALRDSRR